jgi:deoxyribonuclease V
MQVEKLEDIQRRIAAEAITDDRITAEGIKTIAGFDIAFLGRTAVCAAVICDAQTLRILERKTLVTEAPIPYIPGFLAFREGPPIVQLYHDLEHNPDLILVDGHGIAHPARAGLATHIGVELGRPCIGIAKSLLAGELREGGIIVNGERRGVEVQTRRFAKPVYVSPGHLVSVDTAAAIVQRTIVPPHKLPEPIHLAHRLAKKTLERLQAEQAGTPGSREPAQDSDDIAAIEEQYFRSATAVYGMARL